MRSQLIPASKQKGKVLPNTQSLQIQDLLLCPNVLLAKDQKESATRSYVTCPYKEYKNECLLRKDKTEMLDGGEMTVGNRSEHLYQGMKQWNVKSHWRAKGPPLCRKN